MADKTQKNSTTGNRQQQSRLQRRAPASIKICPVPDWNIAIPLLSPLATSPADQTVELKSRDESRKENHHNQVTEAEKPVFKMWQHPAAPFCYESTPVMPSFVPV